MEMSKERKQKGTEPCLYMEQDGAKQAHTSMEEALVAGQIMSGRSHKDPFSHCISIT